MLVGEQRIFVVAVSRRAAEREVRIGKAPTRGEKWQKRKLPSALPASLAAGTT